MGDEPDGAGIRRDGSTFDSATQVPVASPPKSEAEPIWPRSRAASRPIGLRILLAPPMRRVEARSASHRAAAADFLADADATGAVEASFFSCAFERFSVPTRVSLSSPRMNASSRRRATSSWIWTGGLFMK
jgi:hypothetical protein